MSDNKPKTHYRKVFKSDHLGVADLEDLIEAKSKLIFTIREVRQEIGAKVAGRKGNFNIAYFQEQIKPLVLNATNSKTMKGLAGGSAFVEDWAALTVQLYIDKNASFGGEVTGGVRISPKMPVTAKRELLPNTDEWDRAIASYKQTGSLYTVQQHMNISQENQKLLQEAASVL